MSYLPRYPSYKDAKSVHVKEIPSNWDISRIRFETNIRKGRLPVEILSEPKVDTDLPYLSMEYLRSGDGVLSLGYVSSSEFNVVADEKDILVLWDGSNAGEFLRAKRGVVSSTLAIIKNKSIDSDFLFYFLKSSERYLQDQTVGMGIPHVSGELLRNIFMFLPSIEEQKAIVAFLDLEIGNIDELIYENEKLIEILQEKRFAMASHAVTKGLNPAAISRETKIKWLGEIPAHWRLVKMKWVAKMESGHTPDKKVPEYWKDGDIPWVSLNDTVYLKNNNFIEETKYYITQLGIENSSARLLPKGAVVFSRDATIGRCAITMKPMAVSQHFIAWLCGEEIKPEYLLYRLKTMADELDSLTTGATLKTIGMPDVKTLVTPVPPISEQLEIIDFINKNNEIIDSLVAQAQDTIKLLLERRSTLMSAAVTGQIDVRNAPAKVEAA